MYTFNNESLSGFEDELLEYLQILENRIVDFRKFRELDEKKLIDMAAMVTFCDGRGVTERLNIYLEIFKQYFQTEQEEQA